MLLLLALGCGSHQPPLPPTLAPCPASPNCVSSLAPAGDDHAIEPLRATLAQVDAVMATLPRTERVAESEGYRQYVVTTALMRFRDDVQLQVEGDVVHVRSASRIGQSDLGVNRRRVEAIRAELSAAKAE